MILFSSIAVAHQDPNSPVLKTPLYDVIAAEGAKFTHFAGWDMPVQFTGLKHEHEAIRTSVGMFDISHMGKFALKGNDLLPALQKLVPSNLSRLQPGQAQYSVLLNSNGGIIDDIIFYSQGPARGVLIVNAATTDKDKDWLLKHFTATDVILTDLSREKVLIALQGPQAESVLQSLVPVDLSQLLFFNHLETDLLNTTVFIARTGYTGEDGFEIMIDARAGQQLWQLLQSQGVTPCGLGARDTLRLEAAMCLYGQDIDDNTTPLEAGLGWLVHLPEKEDFIGREVLETQKAHGVKRKLVGLQMQGRHIARHGYPIICRGETIGEVTSGTLSPTLNRAIALGYVPNSLGKIGQSLDVEIRGKTYPATVVKKPFYRSPCVVREKL
ncbi:MAG: Aminomethyltransferase [Chroococcopsis gigantea SAG 12.99]|jgi:aminomethyltransferase|nr:glycine cleavage system aminomethyltransferase GcvT [Chlorogloea purpurea SAG 13.99]MDV3001521.1 Aminomethyltransferase [Chroococcopsis gigantea SAG 12.99]